MLPLSSLRTVKLMVAMPTYGGAKPNCLTSMYVLGAQFNSVGLDATLQTLSESSITRARSRLLAMFLENPAFTHLLWWDDDVGATTEAALRLVLSDRDVAAGVYPLKEYNWPPDGLPKGMTREEFELRYTDFPVNPIDGHLTMDEEGFAEVAEVATGFMCIKRSVFEKMMLAYPNLQYIPENAPHKAQFHWLFFENMRDDESLRYLTEDYGFCKRWREIGGKVHVDVTSKLTHEGKHIYRGDLLQSLRLNGMLTRKRAPA